MVCGGLGGRQTDLEGNRGRAAPNVQRRPAREGDGLLAPCYMEDQDVTLRMGQVCQSWMVTSRIGIVYGFEFQNPPFVIAR